MSEEFSSAASSSESAALDLLGIMLNNTSNAKADDGEINVPPEHDDLDRIVFMPGNKPIDHAPRRRLLVPIVAISVGLIALVLGGVALASGMRKPTMTEQPVATEASTLDFDELLRSTRENLARLGAELSTNNAIITSEREKRIAEIEAEKAEEEAQRAAEEAAAAEETLSYETDEYYSDGTTDTYYYDNTDTYADDYSSTDTDSATDDSSTEYANTGEDSGSTEVIDQPQDEASYDGEPTDTIVDDSLTTQ